MIPYLIFWNVVHPEASKDSKILPSKSSMDSMNIFEIIPIEQTLLVKRPAKGPGPVTLMNIKP